MTNLLSITRKIAATAVLAVLVAVAPQFTGVAKVHHASASLCGYVLAASSRIYNGNQEVGIVRLWSNECTRALHSQTVSEIGSQDLLAAVTINGADNGTVRWYGGNLNTSEMKSALPAYYKGHGCVSVFCGYTAQVYA